MNHGLTRGQLSERAKCPFYIIDYLKNKNTLVIIKAGSKGKPTIYHEDSINVIKEHLSK